MLYKIIKGIIKPILFLLYRPRTIGLENFPQTGKVIVYSNHISNLDPVVIGCFLPRKVHFMAKTELFKNSFFGFIMGKLGAFPVRRGKADISAIKNALKLLKEGHVFGIFPEGGRNKEGDVQEFSHGIASIAHRSQAQIIPIGIIGEYKLFRPIKIVIGEPLKMDKYYIEKSNAQLLKSISEDLKISLEKLLRNSE